MKTKIIDNGIDFAPITVEITFENRDELLLMWHTLNTSFYDIEKLYNAKDGGKEFPIYNVFNCNKEAFDAISEACDKRGL